MEEGRRSVGGNREEAADNRGSGLSKVGREEGSVCGI